MKKGSIILVILLCITNIFADDKSYLLSFNKKTESKKLDNISRLFFEYMRKGAENGKQKKYKLSETNFSRAIKIYLENKSKFNNYGLSKVVECYSILGNLNYVKFQNNDKAIRHFKKALNISKKYLTNNQKKEISILNSLAKIYFTMKQYQTSLGYYKQRLELINNIQDLDKKEQIIAVEDVGYTYSLLEQNEKAVICYIKALKKIKKLKENFSQKRIYYKLGRSYVLLKQYDEAIKYLKEALELGKKLHDKRYDEYILQYLAESYFYLKKYELMGDAYCQLEAFDQAHTSYIYAHRYYRLIEKNSPEKAKKVKDKIKELEAKYKDQIKLPKNISFIIEKTHKVVS